MGVWLFVWAMLAVWVLGLFFLRARDPPVPQSAIVGHSAVVPANSDDPYRGLFEHALRRRRHCASSP